MNKFLKVSLTIVVSLLVLLGLAIAGLMLFIKPNDFKPQIVELVKNKTGRDLTIEGDLSMSWYPDLSIKTGKMSLNNTPQFAAHPAIATLNEGTINVKLLPLLSKNIEVQGIFLHGLTLNLITNQQGENNWSDLNKNAQPPATNAVNTGAAVVATVANAPKSPLIQAFNIGNIHVINSQVNWQDLRTNQTTAFKDLTLSAENLKFNQAVPLYVSFVTQHSGSNNSETVKLSGKLIANEAFDNIQLTDTHIQNTSTGDNLPNKSLDSELNIAQLTATPQNLTVKGLQLKALDVLLNSDFSANTDKTNPSVQGSVAIAAFNPSKMLKEFALPVPPPVTEKLTNFAFSADVKASLTAFELQNLNLTLNDTVIKGTINTQPVITSTLALNQLDLDAYLPAPTHKSQNIPAPTLLLAAGLTALPSQQLKALNFRSMINIAKLKVHGLDLQDVQLNTIADKGLINHSHSIKLYQGEYTGKLTFNARGVKPEMAMVENIKQLQLEPFLMAVKGKAPVRGLLTGNIEMFGEGATPEAFKSTMNAFITLQCDNGAIRGIGLQKLLNHSKGLTQNTDIQMTEQEETEFSKISGTANISRGILTNNNLLIKTHLADVNGKGTVNLLNDTLDYHITAVAPELQGLPVNINVTGTLDNPKYTLDVSALIAEVKKKIDTAKLVEQLKSEENKAKLEHALEKLKPEEKEKLQKLAPKAEKLLKKLF